MIGAKKRFMPVFWGHKRLFMKASLWKTLFIIGTQILATDLALSRDVPTSLFGISLGDRFYFTEDLSDPPENLPVEKFTGVQQLIGSGLHAWFEPSRRFDGFPYLELPSDNVEEGTFKTSFRLYLMPVVPASPVSDLNLKMADIEWEVFLIEWRGNGLTGREKYHWAKEMCSTFALDFAVEPSIADFPDHHEFRCEFATENREFAVDGKLGTSLELRFLSDETEQREDQFRQWVRESRLESIRPYE